MPNYDYRCQDCGDERIDVLVPIAQKVITCEKCQGDMVRVWAGKAAGAIPDEIPGGYWVKHGICNEDGTPKRYDSKSAMDRAAKEKGMVNLVEHIPSPGSDKNRHGHTVRWVSAPVISEEERLRHWHEHERALQAVNGE